MNDYHDTTQHDDALRATNDLFAWRGDEVVLLVERSGDHWVIARGWAHSDRLVDVRRWSFTSPEAVANQVRRLAREDTGNLSRAGAAAQAVLAWATGQTTGNDH